MYVWKQIPQLGDSCPKSTIKNTGTAPMDIVLMCLLSTLSKYLSPGS